MKPEDRQQLKLAEAGSLLIDECRMVLPGVQAIFGFQLIAVFNQSFGELARGDQILHLAALLLVALSAALIMTPAAYHRVHDVREMSTTFLGVSARLLFASLLPLALGLSLDVYLLAKMILANAGWAAAIAVVVFATMTFFWYVFPRLERLHAAMMRIPAAR
jgi:hypothetical protein